LANAPSKVGAETTAQLVWILAPRLPETGGWDRADEQFLAARDLTSSKGGSSADHYDRRVPVDGRGASGQPVVPRGGPEAGRAIVSCDSHTRQPVRPPTDRRGLFSYDIA
jgi:hypothetical protein